MENSIGNNLPRVKVQNQFSIKEIVYKFGPISRIEIADRLGLTLPTITTSVSSMIKNGLLKEVEQDHSVKSLGRRTMLVDINENSRRFMGIEIRGTVRNGVIIDARGNVTASVRDENPLTDYSLAMKSAHIIAENLLEESGFSWDDIDGVGITIPGIVDKKQVKLVIHPGYKWKDKKIIEDFVSLSGYRGPVSVENNTIARAFALVMFNSKLLENADSLAYMFISAGVGCPLLNNIKSHFGHVTGDGEVGHMVMNPQGPKCDCGNNGCLEAYSSERVIVKNGENAAKSGISPFLSNVLAEKGFITIHDVNDGRQNGDLASSSIISEAIKYLGIAIANIDNFVRPECIAIEGKLFDDEENRKKLLEVIHEYLYNETLSDHRFVFISTDEYSGAKGAATVAIRDNLEVFVE